MSGSLDQFEMRLDELFERRGSQTCLIDKRVELRIIDEGQQVIRDGFEEGDRFNISS